MRAKRSFGVAPSFSLRVLVSFLLEARLARARALHVADFCSAPSRVAIVLTTASAWRLEPPGESERSRELRGRSVSSFLRVARVAGGHAHEMEMTAGMHARSASCIRSKESERSCSSERVTCAG